MKANQIYCNQKSVFGSELDYIGLNYSKIVSAYVVTLLDKIIDGNEFYLNSASSTGVNHPKTSNVVGGQTIHTRSAFWIGAELIKSTSLGDKLNNDEKACLLGAILLHDIDKFNESMQDHGITGALKILDNIDLFLYKKLIYLMAIGVRYHMGKFGSCIAENDGLGRVELLIAQTVHLCDFLASRKFLMFDEEAI